ncbi:MAG: CYTH domain-containing protein [Candidatus Moraniibacteriota bacterium]
MEEIEVEVDDYEMTKMLLAKLGLIEKHEGEKIRTRWMKGGVEFDIDTWPGIPTFLEIEATSWEDVDNAAESLGLRKDERKVCSVNEMYRHYGIEANDYRKATFEGMVRKDGRPDSR